MPCVRLCQIGLWVSRASYSSMLEGISRMKASGISRNRSVASAISPPGLMYEVCIRNPEISSFSASTFSRSRRQYMNMPMAPSSMPLVPSQIRWDEIRVSSDMMTRRPWARGGAWTPISFSTARA